MALHKKPPLEISFLSTIWVPIGVQMKRPLEKVTQVIPHSCVEAFLCYMHISWVIINQIGV